MASNWWKQVTWIWILACDWTILVTWSEYWPLIGQYWSRDLNTSLWLDNTDHLTWILVSDWTILVTWLEYWSLIGQYLSHDLNTGLWLDNTCHMTWILVSDWTILVTWLEYFSLIGQYWSRDLNTDLWLDNMFRPQPPLWRLRRTVTMTLMMTSTPRPGGSCSSRRNASSRWVFTFLALVGAQSV